MSTTKEEEEEKEEQEQEEKVEKVDEVDEEEEEKEVDEKEKEKEEKEKEEEQQEQEEEVKEVDEEEKEKDKEDDSLLVAIPRRLIYSQLRTQFMQLHKKPEKKKKWAPNISGFIAQLVRAPQRYREVAGSNSVEVLIFVFSGFLSNCINCVHNCEESYSFAFITAVLIRFISYTSVTFISFTGTYEHIIDQLPTSVAS